MASHPLRVLGLVAARTIIDAQLALHDGALGWAGGTSTIRVRYGFWVALALLALTIGTLRAGAGGGTVTGRTRGKP